MKKDKEGQYIMVKESIQGEDITHINIYAPNIEALKYMKHILTHLKEEIDGNTIIAGGLNTPLTSMDRSFGQKINKAREILNGIIEELNLIEVLRSSY